MFRNIKKTIFVTLVFYGLLYLFWSAQSANFLLVLFVSLYIILYFLKSIFAQYLYKYSYRLVPKEFVKDKYTLINNHCIVKYSPNEKLSVQDNYTKEQRREKRIFTIYKYKSAPVDKCWDEICNIFNAYTYFDSLAAMVSKSTPIKIKLVPTTFDVNEEVKPHAPEEEIASTTQEQVNNDVNTDTKVKPSSKTVNTEFISMDEIRPDTYGIDNPETSARDEYFVDLDSIKKVNPQE